LGEDWSDTVNAWSDGLGIEYNVITNVDSNDVGFQFQGRKITFALIVESQKFYFIFFAGFNLRMDFLKKIAVKDPKEYLLMVPTEPFISNESFEFGETVLEV